MSSFLGKKVRHIHEDMGVGVVENIVDGIYIVRWQQYAGQHRYLPTQLILVPRNPPREWSPLANDPIDW